MSLYKTLKADQIQARKDRDVLKAALLTTLMGEIQVSATGNGTPDYDEDGVLKVADDAVLAVIKKFIKNTNEFIRVKDNQPLVKKLKFFKHTCLNNCRMKN